uniref:CRISPR-associated protein Cas6 n=1 Tax=Cyanothece sp. (strain PCC 7425 / ATCC 29141) TaxID=395961 RepID=B8HZK9_CYAP4
MPQRRAKATVNLPALTRWRSDAELVAIALSIKAEQTVTLYPQYVIALHAWFLDQVRQLNPELSAYLHDGESEKAFTLSGLLNTSDKGEHQVFQLQAGQSYQWNLTALSRPLVQWFEQWLTVLPAAIDLRSVQLQISSWNMAYPPLTYAELKDEPPPERLTLPLTFISTTSFRRKGYHLPLPWPRNVFHSYLRRWNDFSGQPIEQDPFLDWVDDAVVILRHQLQSQKVQAGKRGSVTGFTGKVEFGLSPTAEENPEYEQLLFALGQLAPYCGTGHKTTFGLGQTRSGWLSESMDLAPPSLQVALGDRIAELTEVFMMQRKRRGGNRATQTAETWATILARRELGESLEQIAADLEMNYETVKTYVKLARKALLSDRSQQ